MPIAHSPNRFSKLLLFIALPVMALTASGLYFLPQEPHFETLDDIVQFAKKHNLHVHSGRVDPRIEGSCFLANHPLTYEEVGMLNMSQCGQTSQWRGIVFVTTYLPSDTSLIIEPGGIEGHHRIWGNLLFAGDKRLLDQLEATFASENRQVQLPSLPYK